MMKRYRVRDNTDNILEFFDTSQDAYDYIKYWLDAHDVEVYYYRQSFLEDNEISIDYGSHTHCFFIKDMFYDDISYNAT
jgi:hypothetical protein